MSWDGFLRMVIGSMGKITSNISHIYHMYQARLSYWGRFFSSTRIFQITGWQVLTSIHDHCGHMFLGDYIYFIKYMFFSCVSHVWEHAHMNLMDLIYIVIIFISLLYHFANKYLTESTFLKKHGAEQCHGVF